MLVKRYRLIALIGISLLVLGSASTAFANDNDDEERSGLMFGIGLDAGHLELAVGACPGQCEGVTEAGGVNVHLGLMLTPKLAIVGELWGMGHMEENLFVSQAIATVGPKLWLGDRFWVKGGVGAARAGFRYDTAIGDFDDSTDYVFAASAATGFELISTDDFALDLQLRGGSGFFGTADTRIRNLSAGVGINWY